MVKIFWVIIRYRFTDGIIFKKSGCISNIYNILLHYMTIYTNEAINILFLILLYINIIDLTKTEITVINVITFTIVHSILYSFIQPEGGLA